MNDSPLNAALRHFEAVEANLVKLEKVLDEITAAIPPGITFGENLEYENNCRIFDSLLESLPLIDGWKPEVQFMGLNDIAENRMDAQEIGEVSAMLQVERQISEPARQIAEYRYRFNQNSTMLKIRNYAAVTGWTLTRYPKRSMRRANRSTSWWRRCSSK
jgi:hypothetical protein